MYPEKISEKQICDDLNFLLLNILDVIFFGSKTSCYCKRIEQSVLFAV